jgi:hypothetical protein
MKIVKKGFSSQPRATISLWLIPTMFYLLQKFLGIAFHREWVWWVGISTMFLVWVLLNWKIKK